MDSSGTTEQFDTVIVGGGQAGLAVGYHLSRLGQSFVIMDKYQRIGDSWRKRYDSLRLFSPAKYDSLPGMPFPAAPYAFPTGRQVGDYLEDYAARMRLPVLADTEVDGVWPRDEGGFLVRSGQRRMAAAQVVVATGLYPVPFVPDFAHELDPQIRQVHSSQYNNPSQLLPGDVLVVGAGNSGADVALEVAAEHTTWLSGRTSGRVPIDIESRLARPVWAMLWFAINHVVTVRNPVVRGAARKAAYAGHTPLVRVGLPQLTVAGVRHVPARVTGTRGSRPELGDGRVLDVANVVWCTGFRHDFSWVHLPVTGEDGWPRHDRGVVASAPGLYFVGLPFQYAVSSMLVGGVGRDAGYVARHIAARQGAPEQRATPWPAAR